MKTFRLVNLLACLSSLLVACDRTAPEVVPQNVALVSSPSLPASSSASHAVVYSQFALEPFASLNTGKQTTAAINPQGYGVEVHKGVTNDHIWYQSMYMPSGGTQANWSVAQGVSGDDGTFLQGYDPAVATDGTNQVVLVCQHVTGTLSYAVGNFLLNQDEPMLTFSDYQSVGIAGSKPAVAITQSGRVVLVFEGREMGTLYWLMGQLSGTTVHWTNTPQLYARGYNPTIAINDKGQLIEMHETGVDYAHSLVVQTGQVYQTSLVWYSESTPYANGLRPSVALDNDGTLVEVHQSREGSIHRLTGSIQDNQSVTMNQDTQLVPGGIPSVSLFNHHGQVQLLVTVDDGLNQIRYATDGYR